MFMRLRATLPVVPGGFFQMFSVLAVAATLALLRAADFASGQRAASSEQRFDFIVNHVPGGIGGVFTRVSAIRAIETGDRRCVIS